MLMDLVHTKKPHFVFLMETLLAEENARHGSMETYRLLWFPGEIQAKRYMAYAVDFITKIPFFMVLYRRL